MNGPSEPSWPAYLPATLSTKQPRALLPLAIRETLLGRRFGLGSRVDHARQLERLTPHSIEPPRPTAEGSRIGPRHSRAGRNRTLCAWRARSERGGRLRVGSEISSAPRADQSSALPPTNADLSHKSARFSHLAHFGIRESGKILRRSGDLQIKLNGIGLSPAL